MKLSNTFFIVVAIVLLLIGGYYLTHIFSRQTSSAPAPVVTSTPTGTQYVPGNLLLGIDGVTATSSYVIAFNGMPLYTYNADTPGTSGCIGKCAKNWPPYLIMDASALHNLQAGITGTAGTLNRADGGIQVTYNGMPLYLFIGDTASHGAQGNNQNGFSVLRIATSITSKVVGLGDHCGGFIKNAPVCATGLQCQLVVSRPDTGGTCVKN